MTRNLPALPQGLRWKVTETPEGALKLALQYRRYLIWRTHPSYWLATPGPGQTASLYRGAQILRFRHQKETSR